MHRSARPPETETLGPTTCSLLGDCAVKKIPLPCPQTPIKNSEGYTKNNTLPLPEQLCPRALAQLALANRFDQPIDVSSIDYTLDAIISYANIKKNRPALPDLDDLFKQIKYLLSDRTRGLHAFQKIHLQVIQALKPAYLDRVSNRSTTPKEYIVDACRVNVLSLLDQLYQTYSRETPFRDARDALPFIREVEIIAIILTTYSDHQIFPFPAVKREESGGNNPQLHHDIYGLRQGEKIPIQIKSSPPRGEGQQTYGYQIPVVIHKELLTSAFEGTDIHQLDETSTTFTELICNDRFLGTTWFDPITIPLSAQPMKKILEIIQEHPLTQQL